MEWQMIWDYHKRHAGQLWNTIDERGRGIQRIYPENGQIRSIPYTGYHDRSISCLTAR